VGALKRVERGRYVGSESDSSMSSVFAGIDTRAVPVLSVLVRWFSDGCGCSGWGGNELSSWEEARSRGRPLV